MRKTSKKVEAQVTTQTANVVAPKTAFKRWFKPTEIEALIAPTRKASGFEGENEIKMVHLMVENARRNAHVGDKVIMVVDPKQIHIPKWQRKCDIVNAKGIGFGYKAAAWDLPKIICHNGILLCVDGMHRLVGAFIAGKEAVTVELLDLTEHEAIELFLNQTKARKRMAPEDYFQASLEIKTPEYVMFKKICNEQHVQIKGDDSVQNPIGTFTSINDGVNTCKTSPETFKKIIGLIVDLQWNQVTLDKGNAFGAQNFRVLKKLYAYYAANIEDMEKALKKECTGAAYFTDVLSKFSYAAMFDHLSEIVRRNIAAKNRMLKAI